MDSVPEKEAGQRTSFGGGIVQGTLHNTEHRVEIVNMPTRLGVPNLPEVNHGFRDFSVRTR